MEYWKKHFQYQNSYIYMNVPGVHDSVFQALLNSPSLMKAWVVETCYIVKSLYFQ